MTRRDRSYDINSRDRNTLSTQAPSIKLLNCSLRIFFQKVFYETVITKDNENMIKLVMPDALLTLVRVFSYPGHNKQQAPQMFFRNL
jgi:hypothetical protein